MESRKYWRFWIIVASSLAGLVLAYALFRFIKKKTAKPTPEPEEETEEQVNDIPEVPAMYLLIRNELIQEGITNEALIEFITAQAMHETGYKGYYFNSPVMYRNKNLFGMKHPSVRETVSKGDLKGYAFYDSYEDSVKDYALWWKAREMPAEYATFKDFVKGLKDKGYFTDSFLNYSNGVGKALTILRSKRNEL